MSRHRRYRVHPTAAAARGMRDALWSSYYAGECTARGLRAGVDSLDRRPGQPPLPMAQAITVQAAEVIEVDADNHVVALSTDLHERIRPGGMIEARDLPEHVRDRVEPGPPEPGDPGEPGGPDGNDPRGNQGDRGARDDDRARGRAPGGRGNQG